jgi:Outer membrane protein beta-barrel domain/PDZ domain
MKRLVHFALAFLLLLGFASAQNMPAVDIFGGYSYFNFQVPSSVNTTAQRLTMNGWEGSASVGLFHHFGVEGDFSGHRVNNCNGTTLNCSNFSYMFGPRFTIGNRSNRITAFVHGLAGQDRATLVDVSAVTLTDTSTAFAAGAGVNYWVYRHVGLQAGPFDFMHTSHLSNYGLPGQNSYRLAAGIALRFGGDFPPAEPKAPKEPKEPKEKSTSHRSWKRPWHKTKSEPSEGQGKTQPGESQSPTPVTSAPEPPRKSAKEPAPAPSRGMQIHPLGIVAAPQELDGAKILSIEPGSVAEMSSLKPGDLIKSVDGKAVRTPMELAAELSDKTGKVRIGILRGTFATEMEILLGAH